MMVKPLSILCCLISQLICSSSLRFDEALQSLNTCKDPDFDKNTHELILSKGYPAVNYTVTTPDNYTLRIHRIPNGNGYNGNNSSKRILYLHHGLLGESSNFVANFRNSSLGFMAYDAGYDVWMGNSRGNAYGRNNTNISAKDPRFWLFSWDEIAKYDVTTMIDFILRETSQKQVYYAGHSEGTTALLALLSANEPYREKIKAAALLAPVAYVKHVKLASLLKPIVIEALLLPVSTLSSGTPGNLLPHTAAFEAFAKSLCGTQAYEEICTDLASLIIMNGNYFNKTRTCVYLSRCPAGASMYELQHYAQQTPVLKFQKYDYGPIKNQAKYNQATPPEYDLSKVNIPIGLFSSAGDSLANPEDVKVLRSKLPNIGIDVFINDTEFTHLDFVFAPGSATLINKPLLDFFAKY